MNKTELGIIAVIGVAAGSFAYWLYSSLTPAEKRALEDKALNAANKLLDTIKDVQKSATDSILDVKHTVVDSK